MRESGLVSLETRAAPATISRRTPLLLFCGCVALYHANGGTAHVGIDNLAAPYTAFALLRTGSLDVSRYEGLRSFIDTPAFITARDGSRVTTRPLGTSLVAMPFVAPFALLSNEPPAYKVMGQLGKLAAACCVATAAVLFFLMCRRIAPRAAWPATVLFAFGNCLWSVASQAIWMHGPATLWLCWALYLLMRPVAELTFARVSCAGLLLGAAVLTRGSTGIFAVATVLWLAAACFSGAVRWRALAGLALGLLVPATGLLLLNAYLFGHPLLGGYRDDNWSMPTPLWLGFAGLLIAPSRGLLVYSPALMLLPLGVAALWRRRTPSGVHNPSEGSTGNGQADLDYRSDHASVGGEALAASSKWLLMAWLAGAVATVAFFAKWHDWYGGWCFGPRFLCETMPVLCLLFALAYERIQRAALRRLAIGLVAASVLIHALGIFGRTGESSWYLRREQSNQGRWLFQLDDTQIEAYAKVVLKKLTGRLPFMQHLFADARPVE